MANKNFVKEVRKKSSIFGVISQGLYDNNTFFKTSIDNLILSKGPERPNRALKLLVFRGRFSHNSDRRPYVRFGGQLFRQMVGIPMGINCAPLLADSFLYSYEKEFFDKLIKWRYSIDNTKL